MRLKSILAGTAIATLALLGEARAPFTLSFSHQAEAAVNVSFSLFYDRLGDHGDWVRYRDAYVFIPKVGPGWQPYTLGHWVYADRYGWTWVSDEPFGWATYHYGRWGYSEDIGWYWVPGRKWAPAWVSWRRSKDYVVWAPLPPSRRGTADVAVSVRPRDIPDFYWVAVPAPRFLEPDLHVSIVTGDRDVRQVVRRTKYVGTPRVTNNTVVNTVLDVNVISRETGRKVPRVAVQATDNPQDAKATADQVTVYQGEIMPDDTAKPKDVRDVTKVKKVKRGAKPADTATTPPEGTATEPATNAPGSTNAPAAGTATQPAPATQAPPASTGTGQPAVKPKTTTGTTPETPPAGGQAEVPPTKPKTKAGEEQGKTGAAPTTSQPETTTPPAASQQEVTPTDQKKRKKPQDTTQQGQGTTPSGAASAPAAPEGKAEDQNAGGQVKPTQKPKAGKKNQEACDPTTNPDCKPAQ